MFSPVSRKPVESSLMRLALAQINAVVGDLDGNRERILSGLADARAEGAELVLFPELAVTGYPPEDLLLRPAFVRAAEASVREIAKACTGLTALVGTPWFDRDLFNACAVCADGEVKGLYRKRFLPNYGVFDEDRYFALRPRAAAASARRDPGRPDDLRGHLAAGPARDRPRAGGRRAARQPLRLAVPRRQGGGPRGDARDAGARQLRLPRVLQPRRRPGRAPLRRPLGRARRRRRGAGAGAGLRGGAARRRPRPERGDRPPAARRPPALARARPGGRAGADRPRAGSKCCFNTKSSRRRDRPVRAGARADAPGARARPARLRRQERLRRDRARALGRDRLGARRGARGRRARAGAGALRLDAVALLVRGTRRTTRRRVAESLGCDFREIAIEGDRRRLPRGAASARRGSPPRTCRRGSAG